MGPSRREVNEMFDEIAAIEHSRLDLKLGHRGKFDAEATSTVLWIGFLGGLLTGLSLSALYLFAYAMI